MNNKRNKNEIHDMVRDELLALSKVMDVSESMRKFYKLLCPGCLRKVPNKKWFIKNGCKWCYVKEEK